MATKAPKKLQLDHIIKEFDISTQHIKRFEEKLGTKLLYDIYDDFLKSREELLNEQEEIMRELKGILEISHSLRTRIKSPEHLIEKIIRNSCDSSSEKYQQINESNYKNVITDLIGFRIIILGKEDWRKVHEYILGKFKNSEDLYLTKDYYNKDNENLEKRCIVERPIVYTVSGDKGFYDEKELKIETSKVGYRSIHYLIRYEKFYCELQVRTIFDEGWLEFDHKIKYPYDKANPIKNDFLLMMANMAKTSDDMIFFHSKYPKIFEDKTKRKDKSGESEESEVSSPVENKPESFDERISNLILYKL